MAVLDLNSGEIGKLGRPEADLAMDVAPSELAGLVPSKSSVVAIRFYRFSDGRGFTIARRLREALGHSGAILASGHLIPDQAGYLRRCGFSHAEIAPGSLRQWRLSLSLSPPPMQQLLSGRRARDQDAASS